MGAKSGQPVNCGQCHACRVNYTSKWTLRLLYELSCWDCASFVTLTYNDVNLPLDRGLHLSDVTKFRDSLEYYSGKRPYKFYHCGEYGTRYKRPHYHMILFGYDPYSKKDRELVCKSWNKCEPFFFDMFPKNYLKTNSPVGQGMLPVCREDIAYVCGYVQKKLNGEKAQEEYGNKKRPYSTGSHGLGLEFALKNAERLKENKWTFLNGKRIGIPRYFREKLGIEFTSEDFKQSSSEKIREEMKVITDKYYHDNPEMKGNLSAFAIRHFENWYERKEFDLSIRIERDYLQKKRICYGLE